MRRLHIKNAALQLLPLEYACRCRDFRLCHWTYPAMWPCAALSDSRLGSANKRRDMGPVSAALQQGYECVFKNDNVAPRSNRTWQAAANSGSTGGESAEGKAS
jgi:hypothetical protein